MFKTFLNHFFVFFLFVAGVFGKNVKLDADGWKEESSYGSWHSPITAEDVVMSKPSFAEGPFVDPVTGKVFWAETNHNGITGVKQYDPENKSTKQWTDDDSDVATWINGHGGGALLVYNDTIFFSNGHDGLLYMKTGAEGVPVPITNNPLKNYADGSISPEHNVLFYVMEDMEPAFTGSPAMVTQYVVVINITTLEETMFPMDADFFASPKISPDNSQLAWIQYSYPYLPWEETQLITTPLSQDRHFAYLKYIQHGSTTMVKWNRNSELLYVHDANEWWKLYHITKKHFEVPLTEDMADVGKPPWRLGQCDFDINPDIFKDEVVVVVGEDRLYEINTKNGKKKQINIPYNVISNPVYSRDGKKIFMLAGNSTRAKSLIELDKESGEIHILADSNAAVPSVEYLTIAKSLQFPSSNGSVAYGNFYEPKNPLFVGTSGNLPPLIVNVGHGPFERARRDLNMEIQYFTSRGFAVLDVDYRGSSGYGRKYRDALHTTWGLYDADDVMSGATYLVKEKLVDDKNIAIRGSSVEALTALTALTSSDIFKAGTICRGLSDLFTFYEGSSKFDQMLIEHLIGSERIADGELVFASPLFNVNNISSAVLLLHGSEDQYLKPLQSQVLYEKLKENGIATSFSLIGGESHVFNKHESVILALETELLFYGEIFNLNVPNIDRKINIDNLRKWRSSAKVQ